MGPGMTRWSEVMKPMIRVSTEGNPRQRLGNWGEGVARRFLEREGYRVLDTKYRCRWGEVDIVAGDGGELVFVEVRTRRGTRFGTPQESITPSKASRLESTAQHYMAEKGLTHSNWRIDLVSILLDSGGRVQEISHLKHAVEASA